MYTSISPPPSKRARSKSPIQDSEEAEFSVPAIAAASGSSESHRESKLPMSTEDLADKKQRKDDARRIRNKRKDYQKHLVKNGKEPVEYDIEELIGIEAVQEIVKQGNEFENKFARDQELEIIIDRLNAHGDGLGKAPGADWIIAVPGALPGEKVVAQIMSNERIWSRGKLVKILEKNREMRRDDLVGCKYFGTCGGCQYQMLTYDDQLKIKQRVVERAFKLYSGLDPSLVPAVLPTMPSPKQYNYRTKLTPHFDLPVELRQGRRQNGGNAKHRASLANVKFDFPIGFDANGIKKVMDIEDCPIATTTINRALPAERKKVKDTIDMYKNGATILLRDSLVSFDSIAEDTLVASNGDASAEPETTVVTGHKLKVMERVGTTKFESPAGTFFQNNRSILPSLLDYVRTQILESQNGDDERFLVDAYCGSGLFSLCLASLFTKVAGVEISPESIKFAKKNAEINGISNTSFLAGSAEHIFAQIQFPSDKTTVIIDPPRRGCDEPFIKQLVKLAPAHIVYVSCNVHTQARDVGMLLKRAPEYKILSVRGADLFPQTHHVEGVCVLRKKITPTPASK